MTTLSRKTEESLIKLKNNLLKIKKPVLAFSGGVDSTLLLHICSMLKLDAEAVTVMSEFISKKEAEEINKLIASYSIKHRWIEISVLDDDTIAANDELRCYYCKRKIFQRIKDFSDSIDATLIEGTHDDDMDDYRPGFRAITELNVKSPLKDAGFTKDNIRELARHYGLKVWDKPSLPCLATRIPYNSRITVNKLMEIDQAESFLKSIGFDELRVRHHDTVARIEIRVEQFQKILDSETRSLITEEFKKYGFNYISLDLEGYKRGNMNIGVDKSNG